MHCRNKTHVTFRTTLTILPVAYRRLELSDKFVSTKGYVYIANVSS